MHNRKEHIESQVDETMGLLGQQDRIKAGPWFRSQTHNKLRTAGEAPAPRGSWGLLLLRPGILMVVVALNIATFWVALNPSIETQDIRDTYLSTMASEYQLLASWELLEDYETTTEP